MNNLPDNTLFITLGNSLRQDDGIGKYIADHSNAIHSVNPEDAYHISIEHQPEKIVLIDAADFGGYEGEIRQIDHTKIYNRAVSTHKIPIDVIIEMIKMDVTEDVSLIGIQITKCRNGEILSKEVMSAASEIIKQIS